MPRSRLSVPLIVLLAAACERERPLLQPLDPDRTGVHFANTIATSDTLNVQTDVYVYNGAGVAVGDVNGDGRPDLYLAGNMVSSRLYLNQGDMRFEDATERAGVGTTRWATGVTMVDVNADGRLDIYVSVSGTTRTAAADRANLLFVNEGDGRFSEQAARWGIADTSYSTHSAFLDYDGDGCLDLFVLNNAPQDFTRFEVTSHPGMKIGETPGSLNQLYRNTCQGTFENVTERAGILESAGYGLGVVVADLNRDGRPDIYVSNDGAPNDVLYVNEGDGTFTDRAGQWLKHASVAGMGVDVADVNDDGWPDILQVDMMPRAMARRKRTFDYATYGSQLESRRRGFRDDYSVNTLQIGNGVSPSGDVTFSDVAHLAGVSATDWSWSALFADFDNDGRKDVFIGNGYPKAVNDLDYRATAMAARRPGGGRASLDMLRMLPGYEESNALFRNDGDLAFTDVSTAWGLTRPGYSYGAAYADLDDDGRLDLVVSHIDAPASIYRNVGPPGDAPRHWLAVRFVAAPPHRQSLGTSLRLVAGGRVQHGYHSPVRGYMSSVDDRVHFGLGAAARVDTLEVTWPDGRRQVLTSLAAGRTLVVKQTDAMAPSHPARQPWQMPRTFEPATPDRRPAAVHAYRESQPDLSVQALLPYLLSRQGPPIATADVDGDGLDDVFVGGGPGGAGRLFLQRRDGAFALAPGRPWAADSLHEDWGAHFFDANGDGRPDLYVASGGYQLAPTSVMLRDRLYVNQGGGRFARDTLALPPVRASTAAVRSGDFDGDGDADLFVGGRLTPRSWPTPPRSFLLRNEGGRFVDVTDRLAPGLARDYGLVTDAAWLDVDGDGRLDLVTVGEWMRVEFWRNDGARLTRVTDATGLPPLRGWWFSLAVADVDRDGRPDLVAGNLGLNHAYTTAPGRRFGLYAGDFTGNGSTDVVLTQEADGAEYPWAGLALLGREIHPLTTRFPTAGAFSTATMPEAFGAAALGRAIHYQADTFESMLLRNEGGGAFSARPLPRLAQVAPVRGIVPHDVDGDGRLDLIVAGNLYDTEPNTPRADAGNGLWLRGDGRGGFTPVHPAESGLLAPRNVSGLALVRTPAGATLLVANTADTLQAFTIRKR